MNPLLESLGLLSKAMTIQKDLGSLFLSIFASQRQFLKPGLSLPMKNLSCWSSQLQRLSQWSFLAPSSAKPQVPLIVVGIITLVTNNMVCLDRRRSIALLARTRPTNEESVLEFPTPMMTVPVVEHFSCFKCQASHSTHVGRITLVTKDMVCLDRTRKVSLQPAGEVWMAPLLS